MSPGSESARFFAGEVADAPRPNRPRQVGAAFVALTGEGVYLERRADSDLWALIGGGVNDDESVRDALDREVLEETGCGIASAALLGIFSHPGRVLAYPDGNIMRSLAIAFIGELTPGVLRVSSESREIAAVRWSDLLTLPLAATHVAILEAARRWTPGDPPVVD